MTEEQDRIDSGLRTASSSDEVETAKNLIAEYGRPVVVGVGLGLALVLGYMSYTWHQQSNDARAAQMLTAAQSPEQLRVITTQYPDSPSAPVALLSLAANYFDSEQYQLAQQTYRTFGERYPDHPMLLSTRLGKAYCLEALGTVDEALAELDAFIAEYPDHYLMPVATLSRGRCFILKRDFAEARAVYEDYLAAYPDSRWIERMESELIYLEKEMRRTPDEEPAVPPQSLISPFPLAPATQQ